MRTVIQTVVFGLIAGGIYGLLALGVVLVYRGSKVLNLAHGEIGTFALYVASVLIVDWKLPYLLGAGIAIATAVALGVGFERGVVQFMRDGDPLAVAVATIGLLTLLVSAELFLFGGSPRNVPPAISGGGVTLAGVVVSPNRILGLVACAVIALGLAAVLKRTDFGLGVLAAAQDARATRLVGIPLSRISMFVWGTSAGLAATAALLIEPDLGAFSAGFMSRLFVFALAAALVGGLTSLPGAFIGGLVVGVFEATVKQMTLTVTAVPGLATVAVFGLILVVLLVRPQGLLGSRSAA
jgi:branched-chain amino acid transport system permease protein